MLNFDAIPIFKKLCKFSVLLQNYIKLLALTVSPEIASSLQKGLAEVYIGKLAQTIIFYAVWAKFTSDSWPKHVFFIPFGRSLNRIVGPNNGFLYRLGEVYTRKLAQTINFYYL